MRNKYLCLVIAPIALASCASEEFTGDQKLKEANENAPITFNSGTSAVTRADKTGKDAATDLHNQFIVYGEKSETGGTAPATGNLVFQNYQVNYADNTGYTTTSNTKGWEYVGFAHTTDYQSHITTSTTDAQTIKYWDYGASNYVFTAISALPEDITNGRVSVTKTTSGTTAYDKGYTVTLTKDASNNYPSLADLYFSDRNVIVQSAGNDRNATNKYGGNATMTFRKMLSEVRIGMYETIPGYAISAIGFKVTSDAAAKNASDAPAFGAICPNVKTENFTGSIQVTYYTGDDGGTQNHPKLTVTPGEGLAKADLILGTNINAISATSVLATTAATPTWDTAEGAYTTVLPQIGNTTNMKLKVDYTLYNSVTKETITVENATAEVPANYLAWKPNFKYTYLFKISDNTNGQTGSGTTPAGLYPITFDALEMVAEDGQAEYITTVSDPSITTFGVKDGKYVHNGNDYTAGSDLYITIVDNNSVVTPTLGTNVNLYKSITTSDTSFPVTEASLAEAIAETGGSAGEKITYTLDNTIGTVVTKVPGEDGVDITQNAVKLAALAVGTYAVEYIPSAGTKVYKIIKVVE